MAERLTPVEKAEKQQLWRRWAALKRERASWDGHWQTLAKMLLPRSSRFFVTDRNRGDKRANQIFDNTGTRAVRVLAAGLMAGMTSPARPWFRLSTGDKSLDDYTPVKRWLAAVADDMLSIFARSNTYQALHQMYEELAVFGTAASVIEASDDTVIRHTVLTAGEYAVATNAEGKVDALFREFQMTAGAMVKRWGREAVSEAVRAQYDLGNLDAWFTVVHAVEPRADRDPRRLDKLNMAWRSVYFEPGCTAAEQEAGRVLGDSGFRTFPGLAPRWQVQGRDIYGQSPGMDALGDVQQLQHEQLRKANAIDYMTRPPMTAPTSARGQDINMLPGGVSYVDTTNPHGGLQQAFAVNLNLEHLLIDIQDVRGRINAAFFVDLFLAITQMEAGKMTATEVAERHEEKLLMLGPVLERLHNEMLDPLIDRTFNQMALTGRLPPIPAELEGVELKVVFISMLAQAQKAVTTNAIDRTVSAAGAIAGLGRADALDKLNVDKIIDTYADVLGVDPDLILSDDEVGEIRASRAKAQAQERALQMAQAGAKTAKDASAVQMSDGTNAGENLINMFSGYGAPDASGVG